MGHSLVLDLVAYATLIIGVPLLAVLGARRRARPRCVVRRRTVRLRGEVNRLSVAQALIVTRCVRIRQVLLHLGHEILPCGLVQSLIPQLRS